MKRIKRKIRMWLRRMFDPKHSTKITTEERYLMIIISQLMKRKDSELLTIPYVTKCYIKSDNAKIFITVDFVQNEAFVRNHVFGYDIKLSPRVTVYIYDKFIKEVEIRRNEMENEYRSNVQNSLHSVVDRYLKEFPDESVQG